MSEWTHRKYFERFRLNVEQYGEILIAQAFHGKKMGDAEPCFDVETTKQKMIASLKAARISKQDSRACLNGLHDETVRIEVKSKLWSTPGGRAYVIHVNDNKFKGVRRENGKKYSPATHFAVILVENQKNGEVKEAWIFPSKVALELRKRHTKSKYISVPSVRQTTKSGVLDITDFVREVADARLTIHSRRR
jgi:hypothetical protein